ncbi:hypothetical protein FRC08_008163 [Ceratobasidium sp. 394]|nr:hypothetical protein FRC08_008163 [Ceratobasidium sp. 394]
MHLFEAVTDCFGFICCGCLSVAVLVAPRVFRLPSAAVGSSALLLSAAFTVVFWLRPRRSRALGHRSCSSATCAVPPRCLVVSFVVMFFSPGEFLHQFSGMGMNGGSSNESGPRSTSMTHMRPSPLGRSLTIAPDAPLSHPNQDHNLNHRGLTLNSESHRASGVNLALEAKSLRSPTFPPGQVDPTYPPPPPGPSVSDRGPFAPREQQRQHHSSPEPSGQYQSNQTNLAPEQRALVGGGFGSDPGFVPMSGNGVGYEAEMRTPPGFDTPPDMSSGREAMNPGRMGSSGEASPMMFAGVGVEADPSFDLSAMTPDSLAMAMIGQEYAIPTTEFAFP